jgi:hypothetical protein
VDLGVRGRTNLARRQSAGHPFHDTASNERLLIFILACVQFTNIMDFMVLCLGAAVDAGDAHQPARVQRPGRRLHPQCLGRFFLTTSTSIASIESGR